MSFISRDQMLRVVEGGCRFGEIDAVLRDVRFFFLGIPFKLNGSSHWQNMGQRQYRIAI
jgi:hypothetical protein